MVPESVPWQLERNDTLPSAYLVPESLREPKDRMRMFEKPCRILVGRGSVPSGATRAMRSPWPYNSCAEQDWDCPVFRSKSHRSATSVARKHGTVPFASGGDCPTGVRPAPYATASGIKCQCDPVLAIRCHRLFESESQLMRLDTLCERRNRPSSIRQAVDAIGG